MGAKELIQQRKCGGLAVNDIFIPIITVIPLTKDAAHFIAEQIQILFADSHLPDSLIDLGNTQTSGALHSVK